MNRRITELTNWTPVVDVDLKSITSRTLPAKTLNGIIDFSSPEGCIEALNAALVMKIPFVSGTTGLTEQQFSQLKKAGEQIPVFWAPNMSFGVAVLKKALDSMKMISDFDFQIEETHHIHKKDAPSGTAKLLQTALEEVVQKKLPTPLSIRAGGVIGHHRVMAFSEFENLTFEHLATSRVVFVDGAIRAMKWLIGRKPGYFNFDSLLDERVATTGK